MCKFVENQFNNYAVMFLTTHFETNCDKDASIHYYLISMACHNSASTNKMRMIAVFDSGIDIKRILDNVPNRIRLANIWSCWSRQGQHCSVVKNRAPCCGTRNWSQEVQYLTFYNWIVTGLQKRRYMLHDMVLFNFLILKKNCIYT